MELQDAEDVTTTSLEPHKLFAAWIIGGGCNRGERLVAWLLEALKP
jgi:hypothetical protein